MRRIKFDVQTGIAEDVPLTPAEIAAIAAMPPDPPPSNEPTLAQRIAALEQQIAALTAP